MRVKVFHVKSEPTGRSRKDLGDNITNDINAWLDENKHVRILNISHSAETKSSYPEAVVIITYDGEEKKPAAAPPPAETPETEPTKAGRKPKR